MRSSWSTTSARNAFPFCKPRLRLVTKPTILEGPQPQIRDESGTKPQRLTLPRLNLGSHIETVKGSLPTRSVIRQQPGTTNRSLILETARSQSLQGDWYTARRSSTHHSAAPFLGTGFCATDLRPHRRPPTTSHSNHDSNRLHQTIRAFLLDASKAEENSCPTCGGPLTFVAVTFYFDSLPSEVKLPMCPNCTEESPIPSLKDLD
jgi:hypothetical protein